MEPESAECSHGEGQKHECGEQGCPVSPHGTKSGEPWRGRRPSLEGFAAIEPGSSSASARTYPEGEQETSDFDSGDVVYR